MLSSFNFSDSHCSALATASSSLAGSAPAPCRLGSLPPVLPPMTPVTAAVHSSALMPLDERCCKSYQYTGDGDLGVVM